MTAPATATATAKADTGPVSRGLSSGRRVRVGSDTYNRILETLYDEAAALDERRIRDWFAMVTQDIVYTAPLRVTRAGAERDGDVARTMFHFDENYQSLKMRVGRLGKVSAWAENPPSRTRRLVTNVRVAETGVKGEYEVVSYLQLTRSRGDSSSVETVTAERRDLWRLDGEVGKLARREIIVDQSVLAMSNFAVFL